MKSSKVTIGLFLLLLAILSSCAGTEDAPADSISFKDGLTSSQYQKLIHDMHENGEIFDEEDLERLAELESVMHELHNGKLAELEEHMEELHHTHLADLEERMEHMEPFISAEVEEHMAEMHEALEAIDIDIEIPPIPHIPPLPHIPSFHGSMTINSDRPFSVGGRFYAPASHRELKRLFPGIEEDEVLKLQAMIALTRQSAQTAVPTLSKIAKKGKTPAQRYQAVALLAHYMKKDESIVPLLGEIAFEDDNINVRKRAVLILGKCGDDRAIPILENLIKKGSE
ncbi:MAG: HEAT repeat domain-containing protein [Calditrichia bacterium]